MWTKILLVLCPVLLAVYLIHRYLKKRDEQYRKSVEEVKAGLQGLADSLPRNFRRKPEPKKADEESAEQQN